jgi:hypothetical protein
MRHRRRRPPRGLRPRGPWTLRRCGMPTGLRVVAPPRGEERALALAAAIQRPRPIGLPDAARGEAVPE